MSFIETVPIWLWLAGAAGSGFLFGSQYWTKTYRVRDQATKRFRSVRREDARFGWFISTVGWLCAMLICLTVIGALWVKGR